MPTPDSAVATARLPTANRGSNNSYTTSWDTTDYLDQLSAAEARELGPATGLEYCRESSRLTTQLTQVMAWLMAQRAVHSGEMTLEEARSEAHRLSATERCLADEGARNAELPDGLRSLLRRSSRLFRRVAQLDSMMDRDPLP